MARYYRSDVEANNPVSTEITGYAASALVYLHAQTDNAEYLDRALRAARYLARKAWDPKCDTMPFECPPNGTGRLTYFFDCGIIVRGLLAVWRATGETELLEAAVRCGRAMARDFPDSSAECHPILTLPAKQPIARDDRWSRSTGCYQLKSAMAWHDLAEATGDDSFNGHYRSVLAYALRGWREFLPGHPDPHRVMDRLHAFSYFLEGMLPCAANPECAAAYRAGLDRAAGLLRAIAPSFARSDVYAQLLRARVFGEWSGIVPVDRAAAAEEAAALAGFQCEHPDRRIDGGFWFGRKGTEWMPYVNPVSAAFALQALAVWEQYLAGAPPAHRHALI